MSEKAWLVDTEPSTRFPVFTRLNAADVMADPITPLGASMCWIPHVLPGWASGYVQDLVFTALTDTRFYGLNYNIPSLCFGASGAAMHGFNEYVDLDSLRKSTKATALFIAEWCGVEKV